MIYLTSLLFFLLAMLLAIAPVEVVFSEFASSTLWLVFGALSVAEAVDDEAPAVSDDEPHADCSSLAMSPKRRAASAYNHRQIARASTRRRSAIAEGPER